MKFSDIRKPLLFFCLAASIFLHVGAVLFFYFNPISLSQMSAKALLKSSNASEILPKEAEEVLAEKMEKALEDSLNQAISIAKHTDFSPELSEENNKEEKIAKVSISTAPIVKQEGTLVLEQSSLDFTASLPPAFDPEAEAALNEFALEDELADNALPHYESEKYASIDFSDHSFYSGAASSAEPFQDDYSLKEERFQPKAVQAETQKPLSPQFITSLKKLKVLTPTTAQEKEPFEDLSESNYPKLVLPNAVDYLREQWLKKNLAEYKMPDLGHYGLQEVTTQLETEEDIDIDISLMPDAENRKYIFSLTLHPNFQMDYEPLEQNFYFVIDKTVDKQKFSRYKRSVQRSLAALKEGDNFNIYIVDKRITKLSDEILPVNFRTIKTAEEFLEQTTIKSDHPTGLFTSLESILPHRISSDEMHSVILISDGNNLFNAKNQKQLIETWNKKFEGNVNIYSAACGQGNNLVTLDMLSYISSGKTLYSDTNAAFPRKLVRLVKDLHDPIAKHINVDVTTKDKNAKVSLFPNNQLRPPLFLNQDYTIVGTVDELCDFTLFIQGYGRSRCFNIHKRISLKEATTGGRTLEKQWANARSKICYEQFLKNGKIAHLKEAKELVAPYHGTISLD